MVPQVTLAQVTSGQDGPNFGPLLHGSVPSSPEATSLLPFHLGSITKAFDTLNQDPLEFTLLPDVLLRVVNLYSAKTTSNVRHKDPPKQGGSPYILEHLLYVHLDVLPTGFVPSPDYKL